MNEAIRGSSHEKDNDWAITIKYEYIHILNAESGLKGYYCLGCQKEMVAVRPTKRKSHFRHHVVDVKKDYRECVNSSRVYREKLAEQILHRLKELKVPDVYKFPPKGIEGNAQLLVKETIIKAAYVKSQLTFYENEEGEIKHGKNPEIENRYLLIKPDITFFDRNDNPILFVEFVVHHKVDDEKKTKIKRLGINTVQIIIPKVPEDEIEKALKTVRRVKWIYNEIESNTEYISFPKGDTEAVLSFDEEQRKLFEESYFCRAAQVNNLIRSIERSLASQSYRRTQQQFEHEISRIEDAARNIRARLDDMEKEYERETYSEFEGEFRQYEEGTAEMAKYYKGLEQRYNRKRAELNSRSFGIEDDARVLSESINEYKRIEEQQFESSGDLERRRTQVAKSTEQVANEIERIGDQQTRDADFVRQLQREQQDNFERTKEGIWSDFERRRGESERGRVDLESKIRDFERIVAEEERKLDEEFTRVREEIVRRVSGETVSGETKLPSRIGDILEVKRIFSDYNERQEAYQRYRAYLEIIKGEAWKSW